MDDYPVMDDYDYCPICGRYVGKIVRDIAYDASFNYRETCEFECPSCEHALVAKFNWVVAAIRLTPVAAEDACVSNSDGDSDDRVPAEHDG
jgi:hypothetical protein